MVVLLSYSLQNFITFLALICFLTLDRRQRCTKLAGHDPDIIFLPLTKTQFEKALKTSIDLQIALADFLEQAEHSLSTDKTLHFFFFCLTLS